MATLFITATGTDIGKTFVTLALLHAARTQGRSVRALKPVASGFDPTFATESDTGRLLRAQGLSLDAAQLDTVSPWRFAAPLSPDMAAAREGRCIDFDELVTFSAAASANAPRDLTLIEGIGGLMVPLDGRHTVLDWIDALGCPAVLVAGSYLGTLSHTLTAAHTLASRGCTLAGIIISESVEQPVPAEETAEVVRRFVAPTSVAVLPRATPEQAAHEDCVRALIAQAS